MTNTETATCDGVDKTVAYSTDSDLAKCPECTMRWSNGRSYNETPAHRSADWVRCPATRTDERPVSRGGRIVCDGCGQQLTTGYYHSAR